MTTSNPPVMQLVLTVQFAPSIDTLSMIDIADLYGEFRTDYPIFKQLVRAGPMSYDPDAEDVALSISKMPRVAFSKPDMKTQILFQNDRLSAVWARSTPLDDNPQYPGFTENLERLVTAMMSLQKWISARKLASIRPVVGELAYVDGFKVAGEESGHKTKIAEIFQCFSPIHYGPMREIALQWKEDLREGVEGYLQGEISGPVISDLGEVVLLFETTVAFSPGDEWATAWSNFGLAHEASLRAFRTMVNPAVVATL